MVLRIRLRKQNLSVAKFHHRHRKRAKRRGGVSTAAQPSPCPCVHCVSEGYGNGGVAEVADCALLPYCRPASVSLASGQKSDRHRPRGQPDKQLVPLSHYMCLWWVWTADGAEVGSPARARIKDRNRETLRVHHSSVHGRTVQRAHPPP